MVWDFFEMEVLPSKSALQQKNEEIRSLVKDFETLQEEFQIIGASCDNKQLRIDALTTKVEILSDETQSLTSKLAESEEKLNESMSLNSVLKREVSDLKSKNSTLKTEIDKLSQENGQLGMDNKRMKELSASFKSKANAALDQKMRSLLPKCEILILKM